MKSNLLQIKTDRVELEIKFKKQLLDIALKIEGNATNVGKALGYKRVKSRRFNEHREGLIKTLSIDQLKILSKITDITIDEILKHSISR